MLRNVEFFGNTTVGERGQVVLPIELRKNFEIQPGDKLIVAGIQEPGLVVMFKAEFFDGILKRIESMREIVQMVKKNSEKGGEEENRPSKKIDVESAE